MYNFKRMYGKKTPYKYVKKKGKKFIRKRYTKSKSGAIVKLAKDIMYLKSQINAEHKHIDFTMGTSGTYSPQLPLRNTPIILPLTLPQRGTAYNNRVGNQIVITHITCKYQFIFANNIDKKSRTSARARIVFAKNADDVPLIANILDADPNGFYTPMSFCNEQEYRKYIWLKKLNVLKSHQETSTVNPNQIESSALAAKYQEAFYYPYANWKGRIRTEFANGSEDCTVNKPYLILTSDVIDDTNDWDPVSITGTVRITYIDN